MSERHPGSHHERHEHHTIKHEAHYSNHEKEQGKEVPPDTRSSKEALYQTIEQHAVSGNTHFKEPSSHHERPHHYITRSVKRGVYMHTIKNAQAQLKPTERAFSKIIHNDTIETVSELGASTIARPWAIIGGGLFMTIGGLSLLLIAHYFGFNVPLSTLIALYAMGFLLFIVIDLTSKVFNKKNKRKLH